MAAITDHFRLRFFAVKDFIVIAAKINRGFFFSIWHLAVVW